MKIVLVHHLLATLSAGILLTSGPMARTRVAGNRPAVGPESVQRLLGAEVRSNDGSKLGTISDLVFDFHRHPPRLTDVIVRSGLFGPARAVPAPLIQQTATGCQVRLPRNAFEALPPLPVDIPGFFARRRNIARLDREFHLPPPARRKHLVTYWSLGEAEVFDRNGTDVGFVTDALVNLNRRNLVLLRVFPTSLPPTSGGTIRLEIPAADVARVTTTAINLNTVVATRKLATAYRLAGIGRPASPAPA